MRPSFTCTFFCARMELSWMCWPPLRSCVNSVSLWPSSPKTLIRTEAGSPEPSTMPRLVRKAADWAICCRLRIVDFVGSLARPTKAANGMAGMYWPKVPFAVVLKVRLEAKVRMFARPAGSAVDVDDVVVAVSGRTSSVPVAPLEPNHDSRTSSRAMVRPGSMSTVVCLPCVMPASPVGVKVTWYFIGWAEELVTRTSDWNLELMPSAWATAGVIRASGGGALFDVGETGCTRLTETVVVAGGVVPRGAIRDEPLDDPKLTLTAPLLVPT